ncbi:hypothetical protein, partial [Bradyrhizobium sp.]|uniref:hypothetical protein n=1 Tax=Bradyrhizobium sp. TaxID=376 RepID=UPI002716F490
MKLFIGGSFPFRGYRYQKAGWGAKPTSKTGYSNIRVLGKLGQESLKRSGLGWINESDGSVVSAAFKISANVAQSNFDQR